MMITGMPGKRTEVCSRTSKAPITGIFRSQRTTLTDSTASVSRASWPLAAVVTR